MSRFSGKYDLCDHISGLGAWFDKEGKSVKIGDEGVSVYYSDEMLDFLAFKKRTGGVIHQHKKVKVTKYNQEEVSKHCNNFEVVSHTEQVLDKRSKTGTKEKVTYTYKYWGTEYKNLKELNKHGVYVVIDIHFDTLLDLIPYYPYIVSCCSCNEGKETVFISSKSFVLDERDEHIEYGHFYDYWENYTKKLQNHYREIVLRYFNPEGYECVEDVTFVPYLLEDKSYKYYGVVSNSIDENFEVEWIIEKENKNHWTSPKVVDAEQCLIEMSKEDYNSYIGHSCKVKYVKKREHKLC